MLVKFLLRTSLYIIYHRAPSHPPPQHQKARGRPSSPPTGGVALNTWLLNEFITRCLGLAPPEGLLRTSS
ncbi:uncharacterized protein B0H18DRAFT_598095 [Fomitopsis serialis]|uniref:uncharacterized protein n=1 Tax=Fomitopsis serialis TaxID=139415 RepID=UPI0020086CE4|nr:uncharacterized protein B0H18DRAFT_598095 [Neoantrodia serialis]KAH9920409.1 hypothetical protein B0H18DRAFT_598095 [Neoantrodia serialis]